METSLQNIKALAGTELKTGYQEPDRSDNQRHQNILTMVKDLFLDNAYEGDGVFESGYALVPYPIETMYRERREMAVYKNFVKPIVNAQINPIYSMDIKREIEGDSAAADEFILNVDNLGSDMSEFMRGVGIDTALHGSCFIVMDNYTQEEISAREKDNIDNRIMPYVYVKGSISVKCYELERDGRIKSITFVDRPEIVDGKEEARYRKWSTGLCEVQKEQTERDKTVMVTLEEIKLPAGLFPVRMVYFGRRKADSLSCGSGMYDIAKLNWSMYNVDSERREVIRKQGFSQFCMQGSPSEGMQVGAGNVIFYSQDAKNPPMYVSPDMGIPKTIREESDEIRMRIFDLAEQSGVTGVKLQTSGIAKEWDFQAHGFILKNHSQILKAAELWIMDTFKAYTGASFTYEAYYKTDYQPRSATADLANYEAIISMNICPRANKYAEVRAFSAVFPDADNETLETIEAEIETMAKPASETTGETTDMTDETETTSEVESEQVTENS
jgi:hypothetical protein